MPIESAIHNALGILRVSSGGTCSSTAPVNKGLLKSDRKAKCLDARQSLADRIAEYQPEAIVSLLLGIAPFVDEAAKIAGSDAPRYAVPFPGMGNQVRFQAAMVCLIPKLPRLLEGLPMCRRPKL
jgi:hypothetical protein